VEREEPEHLVEAQKREEELLKNNLKRVENELDG